MAAFLTSTLLKKEKKNMYRERKVNLSLFLIGLKNQMIMIEINGLID